MASIIGVGESLFGQLKVQLHEEIGTSLGQIHTGFSLLNVGGISVAIEDYC